jgi:hypothetical protein
MDYECWEECEDKPEDPATYARSTPRSAAEAFAEECWDCCTCPNEDELEVVVREVSTGREVTYTVERHVEYEAFENADDE